MRNRTNARRIDRLESFQRRADELAAEREADRAADEDVASRLGLARPDMESPEYGAAYWLAALETWVLEADARRLLAAGQTDEAVRYVVDCVEALGAILQPDHTGDPSAEVPRLDLPRTMADPGPRSETQDELRTVLLALAVHQVDQEIRG